MMATLNWLMLTTFGLLISLECLVNLAPRCKEMGKCALAVVEYAQCMGRLTCTITMAVGRVM
ncbi:MAG: hypothetical protein A2Y38_13965 [Spirochaetes bacterium GWB1_59_5]|nr:MAG: hypothetical protein A2Y38_13965 [Spirochaetes bacterium GWB1_59_5]